MFELLIDDDDEEYFRLVLAGTLDRASSTDRARRVANDLNDQIKVVKTALTEDEQSVVFSFEAFYEKPGHFKPFLTLAISALSVCSSEFFARLRDADR